MFRTKALKAEYARKIQEQVAIGFPMGNQGARAFVKDLSKLNLFTIEQLAIWVQNHSGVSKKVKK